MELEERVSQLEKQVAVLQEMTSPVTYAVTVNTVKTDYDELVKELAQLRWGRGVSRDCE